jgi:hypothetical protein
MTDKTTGYKCKICNKYYKTYVTLWKHNKKFHNIKASKTLDNVNIAPQNNSKNGELYTSTYICTYCNKNYSRKDNLSRHQKTCKAKEDEVRIMKQQINELKEQFALILKEKGKMHPKTLQKINKQMNNITNNNNSHNNNNNDYSVHNTYIAFPNLDYTKIFTSSQIKGILNKQYMSLEESIKQVHFNENLPEYSNIFITNMRDDLAYVFNGKEFVAVKKNTMLNELVDVHTIEINLSLEKYRKKLDLSVIDILEKFLNKLNDQYTKKIDYDTDKTYPNYKAYKIDHIKLMIYNESDKNKLDILKTMQLEEKTYEEIDSE